MVPDSSVAGGDDPGSFINSRDRFAFIPHQPSCLAVAALAERGHSFLNRARRARLQPIPPSLLPPVLLLFLRRKRRPRADFGQPGFLQIRPQRARAGMQNVDRQIVAQRPRQRPQIVRLRIPERLDLELLALGLGERIIGVGFQDGPAPEPWTVSAAALPVLSDKLPSQEVVLDAEPELVYGGWESNFAADGAGDVRTDRGTAVPAVATTATSSHPATGEIRCFMQPTHLESIA